MMYERQEIQRVSVWKPGHIAILAGSAALIVVTFIVKARKAKPRLSRRGSRKGRRP